MSSELKPYFRYKNSGVEWLGEVPEHWGVKALRFAGRIVNGATPSSNVETYWNGNVTWVTPADLSGLDDIRITKSTRTITQAGLDSCGATPVPEGSVIVSTRAPIGSLAITTKPLCTNQGCKSIVGYDDTDGRFMARYLSAKADVLNMLGRGSTFTELSASDLSALPVPFPPLPEQQAIVDYLDAETDRIDTLISEQRELIELLKEKRQALISHCVTRGLDPDVQMKDSGVEWLGEVPEHWGVVPCKYRIRLMRGFDLTAENCHHGKVPVIGSNGEMGKHGEANVKGPGVTVGRSGSIGQVHYIEDDFWAHNTALFVERFVDTHVRYAYYLFSIMDLPRLSFGTAVGTLNRKWIHGSFIVDAPLEEQQAIAEYLDAETARIDALIKEAEESINLMKEHRSALISACVTGKVRVPGVADPAAQEQAV